MIVDSKWKAIIWFGCVIHFFATKLHGCAILSRTKIAIYSLFMRFIVNRELVRKCSSIQYKRFVYTPHRYARVTFTKNWLYSFHASQFSDQRLFGMIKCVQRDERFLLSLRKRLWASRDSCSDYSLNFAACLVSIGMHSHSSTALALENEWKENNIIESS